MRRLVVLVLLGAALVACGGGGEDEAADLFPRRPVPDIDSDVCGPVSKDAVDPRSFVHVLGSESPEYETDPPTSGPHQPVPDSLQGELDDPLRPAQQVGVLERGSILIHYRPDDVDGGELSALAGKDVLVMPDPDSPDPVIATGWARTMRCDAVDLDALQQFIDELAGLVPGGTGG